MNTIEEIAGFVRDETGYRGLVTAETSLQDDLGVFGDDMSELLDAYAKQFAVDMSKYTWYFHTGEEGLSIGALFFKPPYRRVEVIPITIQMLQDCANRGEWRLDYPNQALPETRLDLAINWLFFRFLVLAIVGVVASGVLR